MNHTTYTLKMPEALKCDNPLLGLNMKQTAQDFKRPAYKKLDPFGEDIYRFFTSKWESIQGFFPKSVLDIRKSANIEMFSQWDTHRACFHVCTSCCWHRSKTPCPCWPNDWAAPQLLLICVTFSIWNDILPQYDGWNPMIAGTYWHVHGTYSHVHS